MDAVYLTYWMKFELRSLYWLLGKIILMGLGFLVWRTLFKNACNYFNFTWKTEKDSSHPKKKAMRKKWEAIKGFCLAVFLIRSTLGKTVFAWDYFNYIKWSIFTSHSQCTYCFFLFYFAPLPHHFVRRDVFFVLFTCNLYH